MCKYKLGIIIPYYNTKEYTDELLSILDKQVTEEVQVILINDGSKEKYKPNYRWLEIYDKENGGVSSARNLGLEHVNAKYITYIDSDDLVSNDYINTIINKINNEDFDYMYLSWESFGSWKTVVQLHNLSDNYPSWNLCTWNRVYKYDLVKNIKFDTTRLIAEDAKYIKQCEKVCFKKAYTSNIIYKYRSDNQDSLTHRFKRGELDFKRLVVNKKQILPSDKELIKQIIEFSKTGEVVILTNNNAVPKLADYALITKPKTVYGTHFLGDPTNNFIKLTKPEEAQIILYAYDIRDIGGIETTVRNFVKEFSNVYDILFLYRNVDRKQINYIRQYVRCKEYSEQNNYKCDVLIDMRISKQLLSNINANRRLQIIHSCKNLYEINNTFNINVNNTSNVFVSNAAKESFNTKDGYVINNFVRDEPIKRVLKLVSFTRLSQEKGGNRIVELAKQLNYYNIPFIWLVFSNGYLPEKVKNLVVMDPVDNVLDYINDADYLVNLSTTEGYCLSIAEALSVGKPVITTPIETLEELKVKDGVNGYVVPFNMQGIDLNKMYNNIPSFKPINNNKRIKELWLDLLGEPKPFNKYIYEEADFMKNVKALRNYTDNEKAKDIKLGDVYATSEDRAITIVSAGYAEYTDEPINVDWQEQPKRVEAKAVAEVETAKKPKEEKEEVAVVKKAPAKKATAKKVK